MPQSGQHDSSAPDSPERARDEDFAADLVNDPDSGQPGGHADESHAASAEKALHEKLGLDRDELDRIPIIETGTALKQGGTNVDLNDPERQPFTAIGGHTAGPEQRVVAKRDADHEIWNRLVGQHREVAVERPGDRRDG
jgi:hypothetical protein